jgi:hypothetical protein
MVYREASEKYGVSYPTWRRLREGKGYLPFRSEGLAEDVAASLLESVRQFPHFNTAERARRLGIGVGSAQDFLRDRGLSEQNARLRFAGYSVEAVRPLEVARSRRIVATRPGSLTHIDFKVFGVLRGVHGEPAVRLGGFVVIDSLTSYSQVMLGKAGDQYEAVDALGYYIERAPFEVTGLVLADNGKVFLSDHFIKACQNAGLLLRTIRPSHPWSNGKAEAMNKTLKYQCFAAIAGNVGDWDTAARLVDSWMEYYNKQRSHGGHCNRGLPPEVFYQLWKKTPGDEMEKLLNLGILKSDDQWNVRLLGSHTDADGHEKQGLPYAFVMDRVTPSLQVQLGVADPGNPAAFQGGRPNNIVLAR